MKSMQQKCTAVLSVELFEWLRYCLCIELNNASVSYFAAYSRHGRTEVPLSGGGKFEWSMLGRLVKHWEG